MLAKHNLTLFDPDYKVLRYEFREDLKTHDPDLRPALRINAIKKLTRNIDFLLELDSKEINQFDMFRKRGEYIFGFSPPGNGMDCYRTWESLLFGQIVITLSTYLDEMFIKNNLPVVIVKDWNEINETMLEYWYDKFYHLNSFVNEHTREKLTIKYWVRYIASSE